MTSADGTSALPDDPVVDERLAAFAGQVSHDLKNPLSAVRMCLELAREEIGDDDSELLTLIRRAERGVTRMDVMINDLLTFARVGAPAERSEVDLAVVAAEAIEELGEAVAPGQVHGAGELPTVRGDAARLKVVLTHLVMNAVNFSAWDAAIDLGAERTQDGWRVSVSDRGHGIPPDQREHVFEPMVRLDTSVPGSGVGLATCRRIVAGHGGQMGIDGRIGGGAVVWFELPD
ncbi:sensor histidine kinase [Nocardioides coralli]|uniref:sensor histidine kinase n=1 Tax=Nocardioides coralli TaxID=2872154 RepID=UPI001CA4070B|nr:HAMP domain-containing sensor histidine kinase [Nocardioides coralli]QZY28049.1 HAMP domain-containing histidine kinase [Nocardioides coralli]